MMDKVLSLKTLKSRRKLRTVSTAMELKFKLEISEGCNAMLGMLGEVR